MGKMLKIILPIVVIIALVGAAVYMNRSRSSQEEGGVKTVTSKDGTKIAYDKSGNGPAVILVDGALASRKDHAELAQLLSSDFTVYNYDRRGRADSGDTKPYAVEREIEDIEALIAEAGGTAYVHGISSGAALSLQAAAALGDKVKKLSVYEAPYADGENFAKGWKEYRGQLADLLAADRHADAVERHLTYVGVPSEVLAQMKSSPTWATMVKLAPTLAYDIAVLGDDRSVPVNVTAKIKAATLVMDGGASLQTMPYMHATAQQIAKSIPGATLRTVEGQGHNADSKVLAPILKEFFSDKE